MSNYVLNRVGTCVIGAVGAAETATANTTIGSVRDLELAVSMDTFEATSSALNDAVVAAAFGAAKATVTLTAEEITLKNLALALGGTVNSTTLEFSGGGGTPDYFCGYFHGFAADGAAKVLHVKKAYIKPGSSLKLGKEQQLLTIELNLLADPDATGGKMYDLKAES